MKTKKEIQLEEQSKIFEEGDLYYWDCLDNCTCRYCSEETRDYERMINSEYDNYKKIKIRESKIKIRESKINEILYNNFRVTIEDFIKNKNTI